MDDSWSRAAAVENLLRKWWAVSDRITILADRGCCCCIDGILHLALAIVETSMFLGLLGISEHKWRQKMEMLLADLEVLLYNMLLQCPLVRPMFLRLHISN